MVRLTSPDLSTTITITKLKEVKDIGADILVSIWPFV